MFRPFVRASVFMALSLAASPAVSDVTLSSSNNPTISLDTRLGSLFAAETRAVGGIRGRTFDRLTKAPTNLSGAEYFYSRERLDTLPTATGGREWSCLSQALYFEARGESVRGIFAVAEVIMNRVDDPRYPSSVCAVINQGTGKKFRCQFTYTCDGRPETIADGRAYKRVAKVAKILIDGAPRPLTKGATHYHTKKVRPKWSKVFPRTTTIGFHHFYRQPDRVARR